MSDIFPMLVDTFPEATLDQIHAAHKVICDEVVKVAQASETRGRDAALYDAAWVPLRNVAAWTVMGGEVLVSANEVRTAILGLRSAPISVADTQRNLDSVRGLQ